MSYPDRSVGFDPGFRISLLSTEFVYKPVDNTARFSWNARQNARSWC